MRREAGSGRRARRPTTGLALPLSAVLAAGAAVLAGCAAAPPRQEQAATAPPSESAPPAPASRPGGYYLDDGPHATPRGDPASVPDAQPREEAIKASATRPYTVMGRTYVPMSQLQPYTAVGLASWYGKRYHGQPTASGEPYDMYAMTAAHPTLPIPSYARVTRLRSGASVVVRINDRGPFLSDRLIDLSYTAAYKLNMLADGSALVQVESILPAGAAPASHQVPRAPDVVLARNSAPELDGSYVQLGAFGQRDNAEAFLRRLLAEMGWLDGAAIAAENGLYRVQAGPYADRATAQAVAARIEREIRLRPMVVDH